jgi:RecA/RadA recombinase
MAKKDKDIIIPDEIKDVFKDLDKDNEDASWLSENSLSVVDKWIDTGSMALNTIMSGSLYKGVPIGRIVGFSGPSMCGKTLMMMRIIANAQKQGMIAVVFDSEMSFDKDMAARLGCDPTKIKVYPVEGIAACRNQIVKFLLSVIEKNLQEKFIICIDSLGNLASTKELEDAMKGKDAVDMGTRSKELKSMMRCITYKCSKARTPIIFSNHIYDNPNALYTSLIKTEGGGKGPEYLASILVQLSYEKEKIEDNKAEKSVATAVNYSGVTLRAITKKNRFVPQYLQSNFYLNFLTGIEKYSGLVDIATVYNIIKKDGYSYYLDKDKLGMYADWKDNDEVWAKILPKLEVVIQKECSYSNENCKLLSKDIKKDDDNAE